MSTVGATDITIVQNAMLHAGLEPIESFNEGTDKADTVARLYPSQKLALLSAHPWSFAARRAQLSRLPAAPNNEWPYQFRLPADRVMPPHSLFQSADPGAPPYKNFELGDGVLLTDAEELWAAYCYDAPASRWPAYFIAFAEHALAAIFAVAFQVTDSIIQREDRIAWGLPSEGRRGGLFAAARFADGRFAPSRSINVGGGPLLQARRSGC
jgi:hypothetical protein